MPKFHDFDYNSINTCKRCKELYDLHGFTDAQIDDYHMIEPINGESSPIPSETDSEPQLYTPYKEIIRNNPETPILVSSKSSPRSSTKKKKSHYFTYKTAHTCKHCKKIDEEHGMQDAQPDYHFHEFEPIVKKRKSSPSKKHRKSSKKAKISGGKRKTQKRQRRKSAKN